MNPDDHIPPPRSENTGRSVSPPFCRVERHDADGKVRHFVVHTQSPKFVVEFDSNSATAAGSAVEADLKAGSGARQRPVIRRVCLPNSWSGDYHHCARQLGAAADFFAATETLEA